MDVFIIILVILGIVLFVYWTGVGMKSGANSLFGSVSSLEKIDIPQDLNDNPHAYVKKAFYDPDLKKYIAEIRCPKLKDRALPVADTLDELWLLCKDKISKFEEEILKTK